MLNVRLRRGFSGTLRAYVLKRLAIVVVIVFGVSLATFVIARVLPGDPAYLVAGQNADQQTIAATRHRLGLDGSITSQYVHYLGDLTHGSLGTSLTTSHPVLSDLGQRLPATFELALVSMLLAIVICAVVGTAAALRPHGAIPRVADVLSAAGAAVPQFWLGLMAIYVFFFKLGWFPAPLGRYPAEVEPHHITGFLLIDTLLEGKPGEWVKALWALALPALTLALTVQPPLLRITQVAMRRALASDAIRTARAMGLPEWRVIGHDALRLALAPILNMLALVFGVLLSSAVLVETVFSWPGIGQYAVQAINASDYPAIQGVVLVTALAYVLLYLIVDVISVAIDPRLRSDR